MTTFQCIRVWIKCYRNSTFSFRLHSENGNGCSRRHITSQPNHRYCSEYWTSWMKLTSPFLIRFIFILKSFISATFMFTGVQTVYDVKYDVIGFKGTGALTLLYTDVLYNIEIQRQHSNRTVTAAIKFDAVNNTPGKRPGQYGMIAKGYPDNGYTQLVSREVNSAVDLKSSFISDSIMVWL